MKKAELEQEVKTLKEQLVERNRELCDALIEIDRLEERAGAFEDRNFGMILSIEQALHIVDMRHLIELSKTDREVLKEDGSVDIFHPLVHKDLVFFEFLRNILIEAKLSGEA